MVTPTDARAYETFSFNTPVFTTTKTGFTTKLFDLGGQLSLVYLSSSSFDVFMNISAPVDKTYAANNAADVGKKFFYISLKLKRIFLCGWRLFYRSWRTKGWNFWKCERNMAIHWLVYLGARQLDSDAGWSRGLGTV
jgi:hypothetical protein